MWWFAAVGAVFLFGIPAIRYGARRYEQRRVADGSWTDQGPKHPTVLIEGPNARRVGWSRNAFYLFHFGRLPRERQEPDDG